MRPILFQHKSIPPWFLLMAVYLLLMAVSTANALDYYSNKSLGRRLASIAKQEPNLIHVKTIAQSLGKSKVWLVEIGRGAEADREARPAMLLVAGIEGNDLIGCSVAVSWVEHLIEQCESDNEINAEPQGEASGLSPVRFFAALRTTTIYVIPRLNPDAAKHFFDSRKAGAFRRPRFETSLNDKPVDNDHDGLIDEDGPEDLNGDGLITWMRVEDREGDYIFDSADDRLLVKADHLKGEVGKWRYLTEGIDNDHDEQWNEDGSGGVNFNRNFPYNYEFFAPDAGLHQVSEAETRALADFVIGHPNIGIVVTYGTADNLLKTPEAAPSAPASGTAILAVGHGLEARATGRSRGRKPTPAIDQNDLPYYRVMGEKYRESLGLKKEMEGPSCPGTFSDWMYFHRGRLSLAACPWSPAIAIELSKTGQTDEKTEEGDSSGGGKPEHGKKVSPDQGWPSHDKSQTGEEKRNEKQRRELKWFDEHAPEAFIRWQPMEHPDFPGQRVEVGGYRPFSQTNPPPAMIEDIAARHADFLTKVVQQLPRIGIRKVEAKHLGENVYEVKIQVGNTGFLPTSLAHGQTTREVHPTRIIIEMDNKCFLSGSRITNLPTIQGSCGMAEVRYVIHAPNHNRIDFKVVSMLAGQAEGTVELAETRPSSIVPRQSRLDRDGGWTTEDGRGGGLPNVRFF